jgi:hypothetical protein
MSQLVRIRGLLDGRLQPAIHRFEGEHADLSSCRGGHFVRTVYEGAGSRRRNAGACADQKTGADIDGEYSIVDHGYGRRPPETTSG